VGVSAPQHVRYLVLRARVAALEGHYAEALASLAQALRKASLPRVRRAIETLQVVVTLLAGDLPERAALAHPALAPYLATTRAVRDGDLAAFGRVLETHKAALARDGTRSLLARLRHNVIKAGLRRITQCYSRIALADVAARLGLATAEDAEFLCAKAIRDGTLAATIKEGALVAQEQATSYETPEPSRALGVRIEFCWDVYAEAARAMRFPPNKNREAEDQWRTWEAEEEQLREVIEQGELDDEEEEE
jgi:26S proteasome regulatory subunit N3